MDYPLTVGDQSGTLRESQSGLYTLFEASLPRDPGDFVRLYVHGGGKSARLGLMEPRGGGLYLCRRLSALERRGLPAVIEYVSDSPNSLHNTNPPQQTTLTACPWPAPEPEGEGLLWLRCTDGTLRAHDGVSALVAFPAKLRAPAPGAALRRIEGEDYLVFRV